MDEYIDVLDIEGNPTGQKKPTKTKDANPGMWDVACGGHVTAGENSLQAAIKELEEELGIHVSEKSLEFLFYVKELQESNMNKIHKCHTDVFLLKKDIELSELKLQKEEVDEVRYLPWKEVEEMISKQDGTFAQRTNQYREFFNLLNAKN